MHADEQMQRAREAHAAHDTAMGAGVGAPGRSSGVRVVVDYPAEEQEVAEQLRRERQLLSRLDREGAAREAAERRAAAEQVSVAHSHIDLAPTSTHALRPSRPL